MKQSKRSGGGLRRLVLLLLVTILLAGSCAKNGDTKLPSDAERLPDQETANPVIPGGEEDPGEEEDEVPEGVINPLTGLADGITEDKVARRPVAIMVSNSADSLPQWGVSQADIVYEMYAEGRITRLVALFQDPSKIDKLASVRSSRPYFIDIAQSYGAVYLHFGGSVPAYEAIKARSDLISIDGIKGNWEGTLFIRDAERRKTLSREHTVTTEGERVEAALEKLGVDLSQEDSPSAFQFSTKHHSAVEGEAAAKITVSYSPHFNPYFVYDESTETYFRFQYGKEHWDGWQKKQVEVKNVLVLRMKLTDVPNSALKLVEVGTTGSGEGYFFCGGKGVEVKWEKEKYNTPLRIYDLDGNELVAGRGQTFVCVTSETADVKIEAELD